MLHARRRVVRASRPSKAQRELGPGGLPWRAALNATVCAGNGLKHEHPANHMWTGTDLHGTVRLEAARAAQRWPAQGTDVLSSIGQLRSNRMRAA
jgi:hypothetical protein